MSSFLPASEQRRNLRRAIVNHPAWKAHRDAHGLDISRMEMDALKAAANALGMDVFAAMQGVPDALPVDAPELDADTRDAMQEAIEEAPRPLVPVAAKGEGALAGWAPAPAPDAGAQLASLIANIAGASLNPAQIATLVKQEVERAIADVPCLRIEVARAGDVVGTVEGHNHPKFTALLKAACARDVSGFHPNIWIAGPAGSGKTHAVKMIASATAKSFYYNGALGMAHELTGFIDAAGNYHTTPFRKAYEEGADYLFDEVDGSDNSALLALNAALANGCASFPDKMVQRHTDSRIFATANTWGNGATAEYVGRAKLDAAFLSRFPVKLSWDYDVALEVAISGNADFARRVQGARERARNAGLKHLIDPRHSIAGAALIAQGFTADEAAEMTYCAGLSRDQVRMVEGA